MLCRPIVLLAEDSTIYSNDRSVCIIKQNHYGYEDRGDGHAQDVFQVAPFGGVIFQSSHGAITLRTLVMSALSERATELFHYRDTVGALVSAIAGMSNKFIVALYSKQLKYMAIAQITIINPRH